MQYHGQMALQIAVLVAFTQLIPEHQVQLFGFIKARVKVRGVSRICEPKTHVDHADITNDLCDSVNGVVHLRLPMPMDSHSIWMASILYLAAILQEK